MSFVQALVNIGTLVGKSISFGVTLGGAIAAGIGTGGVGAIPLIPLVVASAANVGTTLYDAISSNSITSDWLATQKSLASDAIDEVKEGLSDIADNTKQEFRPTNQIQREASRVSTVVNREHSKTPTGELMKIAAPIKMFNKVNTPLGRAADLGEKFVNIADGLNLTRN